MDFWDAVVLIVLICAIAWSRNAKYRSLPGRGEPPFSAPPAITSRLEHDVVELSRRIAVLERIATEDRKRRDIAAEIEALRD